LHAGCNFVFDDAFPWLIPWVTEYGDQGAEKGFYYLRNYFKAHMIIQAISQLQGKQCFSVIVVELLYIDFPLFLGHYLPIKIFPIPRIGANENWQVGCNAFALYI